MIEEPEIAGMMKKAFIPSICLRSSSGTRSISPLIFMRADARSDGCPVMMAEPLSAEYFL
jgi:hypothetical protein